MESENLDERISVIIRTLEIMSILSELHNFNGVMALTSALQSSNTDRIVKIVSKDKHRIPKELLNALTEGDHLLGDHCKVYWDKLRSINPPCVPFNGQFQTKIVRVEEAHKDFLPNTDPDGPELINFSKRRKVADIISEIQQYQNQPYCLKPYEELQQILDSLNPFPDNDDKAINDYLYNQSLKVEPRDPSQRKLVSTRTLSNQTV